ncbi:putative NAC domain-containing protein [Melia azedarach]|uniref:NAC domain-containing protein n=1 Tax=Melia azedarach TaxID=155640 RepID=A0ACC1YMV4_MELAZ|nr:putative NAC domain-containing protein [Melia azedarach]
MAGVVLEGWGFDPNDSEIVTLLRNKLAGSTEGFDFILDNINFYDHEPEELYDSGIDSGHKKRYFLTNLEYRHGEVINRQTPSEGSWTMTGPSRDIVDQSATWKSFTYYTAHNMRTRWLMKEYTLANAPLLALCVLYNSSHN